MPSSIPVASSMSSNAIQPRVCCTRKQPAPAALVCSGVDLSHVFI
jgi:hypothetical protein